MRTIQITIATFFCFCLVANAQRSIKDQNIIYQQERMVYKQWDEDKFTPKPGFLGLNPEYWLTWAWYPDYPKTDQRPLGPNGPQTQRILLAAAMQNSSAQLKLESDTIKNSALVEASNYSALLSDADPLWLLYYNKEFEPLISQNNLALTFGLDSKVQTYLSSSGLEEWYREASEDLLERLNIARTTTLDRGSRILAYHSLLAEYKKLRATWETKKSRSVLFLSLTESLPELNSNPLSSASGGQSDKEIADAILQKSNL